MVRQWCRLYGVIPRVSDPFLGSRRCHTAKLRIPPPVHLQYAESAVPLVADLTFVEGVNPNPAQLDATNNFPCFFGFGLDFRQR